MPRVPTARVTSGQISYTPTGSVAAVAFGALAELTGKAADIAIGLEKDKEDIRRKSAVSSNLLDLTTGLNEIALREQNNPDHGGMDERFARDAGALHKEIQGRATTAEEQSDYTIRADGFMATYAIGVRQSSNRKFVAAERVSLFEMSERTAATISDPTVPDFIREQVRDSFNAATELSPIVDEEFQKTLRDGLESEVLTTKALRLTSEDPDKLIDIIDGPEFFKMDPTEKIRHLTRAMAAAESNDLDAERSAARVVRTLNDNTRKDYMLTAALLPEEGGWATTNDAIAALRLVEDDMSSAGVEAALIAARRVSAVVDDPNTVIRLQASQRAGTLAIAEIDTDYMAGNITLGTRNIILGNLERERDEPLNEAEQFLSDALAPGLYDGLVEKTDLATLELRAIGELRVRVGKIIDPSAREIQDIAVEIAESRRDKTLNELRDIVPMPYKVTGLATLSEITVEAIAASDIAIAKDWIAGDISDERAALLKINNDRVRKIITLGRSN
jgi:hypothetical protein